MTRGLAGLTGSFLSAIGLIIVAVAALFVTMPDVRQMRGCLTTELYHVFLCPKSPEYTAYEGIGKNIVSAVIMSEDASFYSHSGIDIEEMKESLKKDLEEGRFARGASTITQQLVKNVFLSKDKSLVRKLREIYLALQTEKYFTKKQILTLYLNVVEFGPNIYGVKAACRHYFNSSPSQILPEQAAFLAFLLPNPKKYSQSFRHKQLTPFAQKMVKTIMHRMALSHRITEDEYAAALARTGISIWTKEVEGPLGAAGATQQPMEESPMGVVDDNSYPPDESNQDENEFKFDFDPDSGSGSGSQ